MGSRTRNVARSWWRPVLTSSTARRLAERAAANGVPGLRWVDAAALRELEPAVAGRGAALAEHGDRRLLGCRLALAADLSASGGEIRLGTAVERSLGGARRARCSSRRRGWLAADRVVVCAGLHADRLARASGEPAEPRIVPFRGEYWQLRARAPRPRPGAHLPGARSVAAVPRRAPHASLRRRGRGRARTRCSRPPARATPPRINPRDLFDALAWPGTRRMMARHWRAGAASCAHRPRRAFIRDARRYVPALRVATRAARRRASAPRPSTATARSSTTSV